MARDFETPIKISSPRVFLVRMLVFLTLFALLAVVLYRQIWVAFLANPGLNGVILGVLLIGIVLAIQQVLRLFPEVRWVNGFRVADPGIAVARPPVLLAPMAALLRERTGRMAISQTTVRDLHVSDSTAATPAWMIDQFTAAIERLERAMKDSGSQQAGEATFQLADSLKALVQHMRQEQQIVRGWVEDHGEQQSEIRKLLEK